MTTVAVVGPGAIGSTIAAWLTQDERLDVTICTRSHRDSLRIDTPTGRIAANPAVLTVANDASPVDWVLFAVKTYDVQSASGWLGRLVSPRTRVAVLQNGVEHVARLRPYVPEQQIVPVIVDIPAQRMPDGTVRQATMGTLVVPHGPAGSAFVDLFSATPIEVSTTDDFVSTAWTKLCLNAAGAVGALLKQPAGIAHQEPVAEMIREVVAETMLVGRAEGAVLSDDLPELVVTRTRENPPLFANSIIADRIAGRRTEVEARNGAVVRAGAVHGIPTPLNAMLTALVGADPVPGFPEEERTTTA
ncbi:2-dehydropantoate 2-reductase [Microbacterium sp. Bi121]|uniref:2-dehydropantoate 2-reductase n=1 Tax=Microbacterium sp. Bi121 TaxID=2822348 RepID=UPI001D49A416|nr:2-dehydropantoate 2-reductase [Microbacterium sp. Bi121]CAH0123195.1 Putative 2-dehydropantoate 2-reductase [Microbacterium sp. Bi121]